MKYLIAGTVLVSAMSAFAMPSQSLQDQANKYVPKSQVVSTEDDEVKVQLPNGAYIELEFAKNGQLEEASGESLENDIFEPQKKDLLNLKDVVAKLKRDGKNPSGEWSFEHTYASGSQYEFQEYSRNNQEVEYIVDAKTGKVVSSQTDD